MTVKNGIPGQKIRFQINKKRKDRVEGRLLGGSGEVACLRPGNRSVVISSLWRLYVSDHVL